MIRRLLPLMLVTLPIGYEEARRGRFELPWVKPTGLAIRRDGQAMRTSQRDRRLTNAS